jgi:hypothetical protein
VKDAGGDSAAIAKVLFELGGEMDAADRDEGNEDSEELGDVSSPYEAFFLTGRDSEAHDFRPPRA